MKYFAYQAKTVVSVYTVIILFGSSTCVKIVGIKVPKITDLDSPVKLLCVYDIGQDAMYSVKWYKDDREFFRYMPSHNPKLLVFPTTGFVVDTSDNKCSDKECDVTLTQMSPEASGAYTCELSEGGPTFRTDIETKNMTVAALPLVSPLMKGFKSSYTISEPFDVTCYSVPTSTDLYIAVKLNHKKVDDKFVTRRTDPTLKNIAVYSTRVRFIVMRNHFQFPLAGIGGVMQFSCISTIPGTGVVSQQTESIANLVSPQPLRNQKLEWPNTPGSHTERNAGSLSTFSLFLLLVGFCTGRIFKNILSI